MIIKSKRIVARGQALKRTLAHVSNDDDNDEVALLRGNAADLEDARRDALRFGRQYCARHWIVSPSEEITLEQLDELIERLAAEFGFDPKRIVVWGHAKPRATENGARHFHILAPEVDPISGRVTIASSHDWNRHSKISRVLEVRWGHNIVPAPRMNSIIAALEREGDYTTVAALRNVVPPDHSASFDEADHQRLKRDGLDLPRLRVMISETLSTSASRAEFDTKLAALGLRLRMGAKMDTPIIETADGNTLVGSLARLTRLRKSALAERLKFNAECSSKSQTYHSSGDVPFGAATRRPDGAAIEARGQRWRHGPAGPNGHNGRPVAAGGQGNRAGTRSAGDSGSASGRPAGGQSDKIGYARLKFSLGCLSHRNRLLDLLGEARRSALPPLERAAFDLGDLIERETRIGYTAAPPEPTSLHIARRNVSKAVEQLRALEKRANGIEQQLAARQPRSIWWRLWQPTDDPGEIASLEARLNSLQRKILTARGNHASAVQTLKTEENKFQIACTQHETAMSMRRTQADANAAAAQVARKFLEKNPHAARWGAPYLMRVAADIQKARGQWRETPDFDVQDNWSLIPILDLWGKPYLPPPR